MMNLYTNTQSKENFPPSIKADAVVGEHAKQRTVLGVLSGNELRSRSLSQGSQLSKRSSNTDSSVLRFHSGPSSPGCDECVEKASEDFFDVSDEEVLAGSGHLNTETGALENRGARFLPKLSSTSWQSDDSLTTEEVLRVSEYTEDIHQHLKAREMSFQPKPGYLENHPEVTAGMRMVVVDWLAEVVQEYKLHSETLHLAVNYFDRFLSRTAYLKRAKLQLAGTAALFIAAKYEEIVPPEMDEFVYITDSTYTREQLTQMERAFLKVLDFKMAAPTTYQFLSLFMSIQPVCATTQNLAMYLADLSLLEADLFPLYTPSVLAAAVYSLAAYTVSNSFWPDSLHAFTGYTVADILSCVTDLHQLYVDVETHPQQAIRENYTTSKYYHVSLITPPTVLSFTPITAPPSSPADDRTQGNPLDLF